MTEQHTDATAPTRRPESVWREIVVPAARGLEGFGWRVAWFALLIWYLAAKHA